MPVSQHYIEFIHDLLADFEPLRIKRMFGGAGVYSGDLFFAILVEDTLYLKVDDGNRDAYQDRGIQPFSYPIFNRFRRPPAPEPRFSAATVRAVQAGSNT
jgi:TfoX/Sxy family transcriptional regulator of competence genes